MKFIIIQTVSQLPKKIINTQNILCHTKNFCCPLLFAILLQKLTIMAQQLNLMENPNLLKADKGLVIFNNRLGINSI